MVLSISFLLSYESVVDFMIFVETLLFYNKAGYYMWHLKWNFMVVWRSDYQQFGILPESRLRIKINVTSVVDSLFLHLIAIDGPTDVLFEDNVCVAHFSFYVLEFVK